MPRKRRHQLPAVPLHPSVSFANIHDLLMDVLVRLPAKSLSRFKCVCKKWLALISSDHLCHLHTLRHLKLQESIILNFGGESFYFNPTMTINGEKKMIPFSLSAPFRYDDIVQACNGLMLMKLMHHDNPINEQSGCLLKVSYYVYNPTTRRSREIMSYYGDGYRAEPAVIGLVFDPNKSPYYKIVSIWSIGEKKSDLYKIEVYDSESHTWKLRSEPHIDHSPFDFCGTYGTYWNNAIYWNGDDSYLCFDIAKNEVKILSFPENPPDFDVLNIDVFDVYLQESDGHLYHCDYCYELELEENDEELVLVSVWELVDSGDGDSQWIFKSNHRLNTAEDSHPYYIMRSTEGSGSGFDGDGSCSLLTYLDGKMRAYRFLDKSYEDLLDSAIQPWYKPEYQKRIPVKYFKFGEVLALV